MLRKAVLALTLCLIAVCGYTNSEDVIAIYEFEDEMDSSENAFHGELKKDAFIGEGRFGTGLSVTKTDYFLVHDEERPSAIVNNFGITAWVKTQNNRGTYIIGTATFIEGAVRGHVSLQFFSDTHILGEIHDFEGARIIDQEELLIRNTMHNGKWQHIAFTATDEHYRIYLNGKMIKESNNDREIGFFGDTTLIRIGQFNRTALDDVVLIDDVGIFRRGLSEGEINRIYSIGLAESLDMLSVEVDDKLSTTWGEIKSEIYRHYLQR